LPSVFPPSQNLVQKGTLQSMEKEMIHRALTESNQNKSLAAKKLGISRRTLYRKIDEYHLIENK